jgi:protein phosphatase 1 regulatory subunit 7
MISSSNEIWIDAGVEMIDGFKFSRDHSIQIESDRIEEYVNYIKSNKIKSIDVRLEHYKRKEDINFVKDCPDIEQMAFTTPLIKDYSPLYALKHLKVLFVSISKVRVGNPKVTVGYPNVKIDLAQIPSLEFLSVERSINIINLDKCVKLKTLAMGFYNPKSNNLAELSNLSNLQNFSIYRSQITSFNGLGKLNNLAYLFIYSLPRLQNIDELEKISDHLQVLTFEGCKRLENFEYVARLKKLQVLKFINCGTISNLQFIKQMPNLKAFVFLGTDIADGDLSPCLGLEWVGFQDKRHFTIKRKEFNKHEASPEVKALLSML